MQQPRRRNRTWPQLSNPRRQRNVRFTEYVYDHLHRRTAEKWMNGSTVLRTTGFSYDAAGQLLEASDEGSEYAYTYDGLGRRLTVTNIATG